MGALDSSINFSRASTLKSCKHVVLSEETIDSQDTVEKNKNK
jgi:hypothetical protein